MDKAPRRRGRSAGIAAGLLAALLLVPSTRLIVWTQVQVLLGSVPSMAWLGPMQSVRTGGDPGASDRREDAERTAGRSLAARYPDDEDVQIGAALSDMRLSEMRDPSGRWLSRSARLLLPARRAHPDSLPLNAAFVSYACHGTWLDSRLAELPAVDSAIRSLGRSPSSPQGSDVTELLTAAQDGERVDPDNAFFPQMQAVALFAMRRDSEALGALERAAARPAWRDYAPRRQEIVRVFLARAYGEQPGIANLIRYGALLPTHYSQLQAAAQLAVAQAVDLELQGKREEGFQIRRSLAHLGGLVRAGSTVMYGCEEGAAVTRLSMARLGGAQRLPPIRVTDPDSYQRFEQRRRDELARYVTYLRSIGHAGEAEWIRDEVAAAQRAHDIAQDSANVLGPGWSLYSYSLWIVILWFAGCAVLSNVLWVAALGLLYRLAGKAAATPDSPRNPRCRWLAALAGLLVGAAGLALLAPHVLTDMYYRVAYAAALPMSLLWLRGAASRRGGGGRAQALAAAKTAACVAAAMWGAALLVDASAFTQRFAAGMTADPAEIPDEVTATILLVFGLVPALLAIVGTLGGLCCRVPLSSSLVRVYRGLAMPTLCVLLAGYAAIVVQTARVEAQCSAVIGRLTAHEGRYLAELTGREWPGRTP